MFNTFIVYPLVNLLLVIYDVVFNNFGLAIIVFTILIRLVTHPLMLQQIKSSQAMQELQKSKEWLEIQKKYKDNREKLAQEQMRIYQEKGISPFSSCLPLLIQLPIMIAFYQAIVQALAATPIQFLAFVKNIYPFVNVSQVVPLNSHFLWMDLGQPERLPIFGVGIPVLAILVVITTYLQSKMTVMPSSGAPNDQSAQMASMMNLYMPLLMGYISYTLASGLALYFVVSNIFSIGQYAALGKLDVKNVIPARWRGKLPQAAASPSPVAVPVPADDPPVVEEASTPNDGRPTRRVMPKAPRKKSARGRSR